MLHPFFFDWNFDVRILITTQPTPFVRIASFESLHLSFFFLSEPLFFFSFQMKKKKRKMKRKKELAQDCPFLLIPGFL
jgi:hypothetical protein